MGLQHVPIEGLWGTGEPSVCDELQRHGSGAMHGDLELALRGGRGRASRCPARGTSTTSGTSRRSARALAAGHDAALTVFCGDSRNSDRFIDLFDEVFVLEVDLQTLTSRLDQRSHAHGAGGTPTEQARIERRVRTGGDVPRNAVEIDGTEPLPAVVDAILRHPQAVTPDPS